jgi:hypothetical protein
MQKDIQAFGLSDLEILLLSFNFILLSHNVFVFVAVLLLSIDLVVINRSVNFDDFILLFLNFSFFEFDYLTSGYVQVFFHNIVPELRNESY